MSPRTRYIIIGLGVLAVAVVITFPLWRPYFVNDVVDEAFPELDSEQQTAFTELTEDQQDAYVTMKDENAEMAVAMVKAAIEADSEVPEAEQTMPEMTDPVILAQGSFIEIDVVHGAEGTATIYQLPDSTRVLRLEDFRSTNGPDLHVILSKDSPATTLGSVGEDYIDLGRLKGNVGSQNYDIPAEVDLDDYGSVVIYCVPFHVVFSTAAFARG
jgi:hypothetical protein